MKVLRQKEIASEYHARPLTFFDAEEFQEIRLESLRHYGLPFQKYHDQESIKPIKYWEKMCTETKEHCFFGLFFHDKLIGVMGGRKWEKAPDDKVAFWWGNYTKRAYRGLGVTKLLYQVRIDWTRNNGYRKAMLYVKDGADRPAEIIEKLGAKRLHGENISFCGGEPISWHWYELDMKVAPKNDMVLPVLSPNPIREIKTLNVA